MEPYKWIQKINPTYSPPTVIKNKMEVVNHDILNVIEQMVNQKLKMDKLDNSFNYHHLACFWQNNQFHWKGKLSIGENSQREARSGCCYCSHAEMDAIRKLPPLKLRGRKQEINLIVIRVDRLGSLKNSTPCFMCIKYMNWINIKSSYKIKTVCHSDSYGNVIIRKFNDLLNSSEKHISQRFRDNK